MQQITQKNSPYFELVKNEGRYNEKILKTSEDKYMLNRRKVNLIKKRGRNTFRVRPMLVRV